MFENVLKSPAFVAGDPDATAPLTLLLDEPHQVRKTKLWVLTVASAAFVIIAGVVIWLWGYPTQKNNPGFWQFSLVAMLFWLSITQGLMALSVLSRLAHASWRYPLNRLLDMGSLFGVWVPALLPFLIVARNRIYILGNSGFYDNVWRLAGPIWFDAIAVGTCYVAGWALLFLTSLPDFAILRERPEADERERRFYNRISRWPVLVRAANGKVQWEWVRWTGAEHQWRVLRRVEGVLVVGILVAFVASQTLLGWDFQLAAARDWDSSIFAPLYTVGSLLGGCAMAVILMTVTNRFFVGKGFIEERHYDNIGRFMIALGLIWFYFRWCDYLTAWYGHAPDEWQIENARTIAFPILAALMVIGCFAAPVFGNMIHRIRTSLNGLCTVSVFVLTGLAIQRYLDTVPTFAPNYPTSALVPSIAGLLVFFGLAGMFVLTYLFFARYFPVMSWWGTAKERMRTTTQQMGNAQVTVMVEDPPVWET
jgi:hypothetical protein